MDPDRKFDLAMAERLRLVADHLESGEFRAERSCSEAGIVEATQPVDIDCSWDVAGIYREHIEYSKPEERLKAPPGEVLWDSTWPGRAEAN